MAFQPSAEQRDTNQKQRVLLIDRMRLSRDCLARQIQDLCPDFELTVFPSPDSAVDLADGRAQHVAILNVHGADLSNLEVTRELDRSARCRRRSSRSATRQSRSSGGSGEARAVRGFPGRWKRRAADGGDPPACSRAVISLPSARRDVSTVQGFAKPEPDIRAAGGPNQDVLRARGFVGNRGRTPMRSALQRPRVGILPLLRQGLQNKTSPMNSAYPRARSKRISPTSCASSGPRTGPRSSRCWSNRTGRPPGRAGAARDRGFGRAAERPVVDSGPQAPEGVEMFRKMVGVAGFEPTTPSPPD